MNNKQPYKYDVHIHTTESSKCGKTSGAAYVQAYKDQGYDGIIITDHFFHGNTAIDINLPWEDFAEHFCKGYEVAKKEGDMVGLKVFFGWEEKIGNDEYLIYGPDKEWLKKHPGIRDANHKEYYNMIHEAGGLMVEAHPFRERGYVKTIELHPYQCDAMEVCNSGNTPSQDYLAFLYCKKNKIIMTSGSDLHDVKNMDLNFTSMLFSEPLESVWDYVKRVKIGHGFEVLIPEERKNRLRIEKVKRPIQLFDKNNVAHDVSLEKLFGKKVIAKAMSNTKLRIILEGHFMTYKTAISTFWNRNHDVSCISGDWDTKLGCPLWGFPTHPSRRAVKKAYDSIISFMELFPEQTFIIDRFHISQQYYDKIFGTHYYDEDIERRLASMNTIIVYLRNRFDNYEEALKSRMRNRHSQIVKYPKTNEEYQEQECLFTEILHKTTLPFVEYDVTSKSVNDIVSDIENILKKIQ